jgi:hypothetical protein
MYIKSSRKLNMRVPFCIWSLIREVPGMIRVPELTCKKRVASMRQDQGG